MSILRMFLRAALMALIAVAVPSWASDTLPTSENSARQPWKKMKPSSFPVDMISVLQQCNRAAKVSGTDRLTTAQCQNLPGLIEAGKCEVKQVPDGIVFDYMNGHESGHSRVARGVKKALGGEDRALICNLGNRTFAYWFTGDKGKSCNNIGIVFTAVPAVVVPAPAPAPTQSPVPVAGVCGSNAKRYSATETNWSSGGNFCASGEQSPRSTVFPLAGGSTQWSCLGKNGGKDESCGASRDTAPPPPPVSAIPRITRDPTFVHQQQGQFTRLVDGRVLETCNGIIYSEGVTTFIPASQFESSGITIRQPQPQPQKP